MSSLTRVPPIKGAFLDRLYGRIERRGPAACHPWRGGVSRGGWREVEYGCIREDVRAVGHNSRRWRVHRLVLILKTAPLDVPRDPDEEFFDWLHRAARHYRGREASHTCDWSLCANADHLAWQTHADNVRDGAERRRMPRPRDEDVVNGIVRELRRARASA